MAFVVHVDLCTNRSALDNSTHQSRPHNPFLKDRTKGRQRSGHTAQKRTNAQDDKKKKMNANKRPVAKHEWQTDKVEQRAAIAKIKGLKQ